MKVGREMANAVGKEAEKKKAKLNLEETKLRLGPPVQGGQGDTAGVREGSLKLNLLCQESM